MEHPKAHPEAHSDVHTPIPRIVAIGAALAAVLAIIVLAFSWPAVTADPRDVPIAIAAPEPVVAQVGANLPPGAIELITVADRDEAVEKIRSREVYGAIVVAGAPEVLTASAGSPVVSQLLTAIAAGVPGATVTDVVPLSPDDPRGSGLTAAMFPLVMGGMIGGIGISFAVIGALRRVAALGIYAVVGGLVLTTILQNWFGALQGSWALTAGVVALSLAAIAAPITGLVALVGRAGIAVGPVLFMLVANPISGASLPPHFLPGAWGTIGQWFPPGASATLMRDVSYFPDADPTFGWLVLLAWAGVGVILSIVGHFRTAGAAEPDTEAALAA